ncbi:hypothetical protein [Haliangium sp.]|uniref:hypothetical protein n=1 Tax=Haliangium sp. TaxID=2663208 RepID=UPI003D124AF5
MSPALIMVLVALAGMVAGVLIGRYYVPDRRHLERAGRRARRYARVLEHILAEHRDDALAELRVLVDENTDDLEPYFALAALFRARGEWERAVRIHQALALRAPKDRRVRLRALYGLGRDFRRAGMPRRATRALEHCLALDGKHEAALADLAVLYEEQSAYSDAADALERRARLRSEDVGPRVHHLYVAAAQKAVHAGEMDQARRLLREARRVGDDSVHVLVAEAELAAAQGRPDKTAERLGRALGLAPELAPFLVPGLVEAQRHLALDELSGGAPADDDQARALNQRVATRSAALIEPLVRPDDPHIQLALAELRSHFAPDQALADFHRLGERFRTFLPAQLAAARLVLADGDPAQVRAALIHLAGPRGILSWATRGTWRCERCSYRQSAFFWRCRECRAWGSVRLDVGPAALERSAAPTWELSELPRGGVETALVGAIQQALPAPALALGASVDAAGDASRLGAGAPADDDADAPLPDDADGPSTSLWGRVGRWLSGRDRGADDALALAAAPPTDANNANDDEAAHAEDAGKADAGSGSAGSARASGASKERPQP